MHAERCSARLTSWPRPVERPSWLGQHMLVAKLGPPGLPQSKPKADR
jgi:hypothetical protein